MYKKRRQRKRRRQRKERGQEKRRRQRKEERQRKEREGQEKKRRQRKGCIPASLYMKMIDSISANYRNHNCQCFIYETNYLS